MVSFVNLGILLACVLFSVWRAYRKGIWQAGLNLLGFVLGYAASIVMSPWVLGLLSGDESAGLGMVVGVPLGIFIAISLMVSLIPPRLYPVIKDITPAHRRYGAALGVCTGIVGGVVAVWFAGVISGAIYKEKARAPDMLSDFSSRLIGNVAGIGAKLMDANEVEANIVAAAVRSPQEFSAAFESISSSPELKVFWRNARAQALMAQGDIDSLMNEQSFIDFTTLPAVQHLMHETRPEDIPEDALVRHLASQMSYVWQRIRYLRSGPRVTEVLQDPEVNALIEQQNTLGLLANDKVQTLISIVMEAPDGVLASTLKESNLHSNLNSNLNSNKANSDLPTQKGSGGKSKPDPHAQINNEEKVIYKWLDDEGKVRYTDAQNIPEHKREQAQPVIY